MPTMTESCHPFAKEGYELMGAAFEVHNILGGGLLEEIYQQALEIELSDRGIPYTAKRELTIYYKSRLLEKKYIPDIFVSNAIIVELKASSALSTEHEAQLMNYMRITKNPIGYLINFGPMGKLEYKRIIFSEYLPAAN